MNEILRRTMRSFLRKEEPETRDEAIALLGDWFSRYGVDGETLAEEADRHFRLQASAPRTSILQ